MSTDGAAKALSELPLTLPVDRGGPHRCSGRAPPGLREGTVVHRVESEVVVEAGHEIDCFGGIAGDDEGYLLALVSSTIPIVASNCAIIIAAVLEKPDANRSRREGTNAPGI